MAGRTCWCGGIVLARNPLRREQIHLIEAGAVSGPVPRHVIGLDLRNPAPSIVTNGAALRLSCLSNRKIMSLMASCAIADRAIGIHSADSRTWPRRRSRAAVLIDLDFGAVAPQARVGARRIFAIAGKKLGPLEVVQEMGADTGRDQLTGTGVCRLRKLSDGRFMAFITIVRGDDNRDEVVVVLERIRIIFFGPMTINASHIVYKMLTL